MTSFNVKDTTKLALAQSLKELLRKAPLNKITIKNLTDQCGLNRHTFYYHFRDVYELLEWTLEQDAISLLEESISRRSYKQGIRTLLNYIAENRVMCRNVLTSEGNSQFLRFVYNAALKLVGMAVDAAAEGVDVSDGDRRYVVNFYTVAITGLFEQWVVYDMSQTPDELLESFAILMNGSFNWSLRRFADYRSGLIADELDC